jgi:hypothetical protein
MIKDTNFHGYRRSGWPEPTWLQQFFLTAAGRKQAFGDQESYGLKLYGIDGTEHVARRMG